MPAHITLFHKLPAEYEQSIQQTLQEVCFKFPVISLSFPKLRFLGQGVAVEVESSQLIQLRHQLANTWQDWLSRQDQQGYRPHITIQNKTSAEEARSLYNQLTHDWSAMAGYGEGVLLWRYQDGPWEFVNEFPFH